MWGKSFNENWATNDTDDSNSKKHIKTPTIIILHMFKKIEESISLLRKNMKDIFKT